jgi:hypothetical protein
MKILFFVLALVLSAPASAAWVFPDKTADVTADKTSLNTRWNAILTEAKTYASMVLNGSGSLPKVTFPLPGGKTAVMDLSEFNSQAAVIGLVVVLVGVILAFYIVLS